MNIDIIKIPKIEDPRGNLSVLQGDILPFSFQRIYYLYDVPSGAERGGHSHKAQKEFLIALSGSFTVVLNDGHEIRTVTLNKPNEGLLIHEGIWRELNDFSSGSVCLVVASGEFDEEDYIREFSEFITDKRS